jgi:hypothetical protein
VDDDEVERFAFDWDMLYRPAGMVFGVTPWSAHVDVSPSELLVRFGPWSLRSALSNITGVELSTDYAFIKTAGPPHLSLSDRGITFATNGRSGVCVAFREAVKGIEPTGRIRHPAATLTVGDASGLARALGFTVTPR